MGPRLHLLLHQPDLPVALLLYLELLAFLLLRELLLVDGDLLVDLLLELLPDPLLLLPLVHLPSLPLLLHLHLVLPHDLLLLELEISIDLLDRPREVLLQQLPLLLQVLVNLRLDQRVVVLREEGVRARTPRGGGGTREEGGVVLLLFFEFLFLLRSLSVNFVQRVLMRDKARLHIHKVEDITRAWVLDGSPRLRDWSFQTLYCDPQKVLIRVDINSKELSVFNDLVLSGLILIALLI